MAARVFITGASSGLGEELAYYYARRGAQLGLAARRAQLLATVAENCRAAGGTATVFPLDVTDPIAGRAAAEAFVREYGGIDLLIANAGVSGGDRLKTGDPTAVNTILATNLLGITNVVYPFIPVFREQRQGRIVVISSIAGVRGLPNRSAYSASKAAVKIMADGWRMVLKRDGIAVTTIYPGFVRTPMTANRGTIMPFLMDADRAAAKIAAAIAAGRKNYMFPWPWRWLFPLIKSAPDWLVAKVV